MIHKVLFALSLSLSLQAEDRSEFATPETSKIPSYASVMEGIYKSEDGAFIMGPKESFETFCKRVDQRIKTRVEEGEPSTLRVKFSGESYTIDDCNIRVPIKIENKNLSFEGLTFDQAILIQKDKAAEIQACYKKHGGEAGAPAVFETGKTIYVKKCLGMLFFYRGKLKEGDGMPRERRIFTFMLPDAAI